MTVGVPRNGRDIILHGIKTRLQVCGLPDVPRNKEYYEKRGTKGITSWPFSNIGCTTTKLGLSEIYGQRTRTDGLSVTLSGPDGRVFGGVVAGLLVAASPVQKMRKVIRTILSILILIMKVVTMKIRTLLWMKKM